MRPGLGLVDTCVRVLAAVIVVAGGVSQTTPSAAQVRATTLQPMPFFADVDRPREIAVGMNGDVYVSDGFRIIVVDSGGRAKTSLGRRGRGPGEFTEVTAIAAAGPDTLVAWDGQQRRLTWLGVQTGRVLTSQEVLRAARYASAGRAGVLAVLPTGIRLAWRAEFVLPDGPPDTVFVTHHDPAGDAVPEVLGRITLSPWHRFGEINARREPFGPRDRIAVGPDGTVAFGDGVSYCVTILLPEERSARPPTCIPWRRAPIADARRVLTGQPVAGLPEAPVIGTIVRGQDYSAVRNSYDELVVDDRRRIWVRVVDSTHRWHPGYMARLPELRPPTYHWEVRDISGRLVAAYDATSRFRITAIRHGRAYGVFEEEDGSETVRVAMLPRMP